MAKHYSNIQITLSAKPGKNPPQGFVEIYADASNNGHLTCLFPDGSTALVASGITVGSTANLPLITGANGALAVGSWHAVTPSAATDTGAVGTSTSYARGDHAHPKDSSKIDANADITASTKCKISYDKKGLVTAGEDLAASDIPALSADKITSGVFDIARIPQAALERLIQVADETARFALTDSVAQAGDSVKQLDTGAMYIIVDDTKLNSAAGYVEYTAGSAASVPWTGVQNTPTTLSGYGITDAASSSHTHSYAGSASAGGAAASADKINTNAGSATQPVYFSNGVPVATTYTLAKSVPSNAEFTDTKYPNMTGASTSADGSAGLAPAPAKGAANRYLRSDGAWQTPPNDNTTYSAGTGIIVASNTITNSGVRSVASGDSNGTIKVNTNGTSADVAVKGLGSAAYTASTAYAASSHTHSYAGSASAGGAATSADKLNTNAGSLTQPVYFSNGVPVATTYTLGKSVPSNAVFTDTNTTYSANNGISLSGTTFSNSGVRSVAAGSANGTISVNTNGTAADVAVKGLGSAAYTASTAYAASSHTHSYAGSASAGGAATSADKLNTNAGSATQPVYFSNGVPVATTYTLAKSVPSNAEFTDTKYPNMTGASTSANGAAGLAPAPAKGAANRYLRSDGTWQTPPNDNTTYSANNGISLSGTTFSNSGVRSVAAGSANGTIKVNTNGTSADVAVKGLGSAAYTASTAYAASSHTHGSINSDGAIGTTANLPLITGTNGVVGAGSWHSSTPAASTATGSTGSSNNYARGDHAHPSRIATSAPASPVNGDIWLA